MHFQTQDLMTLFMRSVVIKMGTNNGKTPINIFSFSVASDKHFTGEALYSSDESLTQTILITRVYPKVSGLNHNEIYAYLWYCSLLSPSKGYGGKTH
jgi:hypothetical protein